MNRLYSELLRIGVFLRFVLYFNRILRTRRQKCRVAFGRFPCRYKVTKPTKVGGFFALVNVYGSMCTSRKGASRDDNHLQSRGTEVANKGVAGE